MDAIRQVQKNFENQCQNLGKELNGTVARFRKKMKSIKDETDQLYGIITKFENATKEADQISKEVLDCVFNFTRIPIFSSG